MREQLQMKKKKMIDELRELRKEYKLQNELNSTMDAGSQYGKNFNSNVSETNTTLRLKRKLNGPGSIDSTQLSKDRT